MKYRVTTINPDGTEKIDLMPDRPDLKYMQEAVGGYIEKVPAIKKEAYVNEEGMLEGLAPNLKGMQAVEWPGDYALVGPILIIE